MNDAPDTARHWIAHARDAGVSARLEAIYAGVAREIEARAPACWASGRCCNFDKAGHLLYVTGLEAAYTLVRHACGGAEAARPCAVTLTQVKRADCPFLNGNTCGVHTIKPLGCRVYFCDRSARVWQEELTERAMREIRHLHDEAGIEYAYAEWRTLLAMVAAAL